MNSSTARIGYARISTADQNLDARIAALKAAGCAMIRTEAGCGSSLKSRPELGIILDFIHPGETLAVTRIDGLARSMRDLQAIVEKLREKGARLAATERPVDTSGATGKAFFDMLGAFAEFETSPRRERRAEGIVAAKQRVAYRGRPAKIDKDAKSVEPGARRHRVRFSAFRTGRCQWHRARQACYGMAIAHKAAGASGEPEAARRSRDMQGVKRMLHPDTPVLQRMNSVPPAKAESRGVG